MKFFRQHVLPMTMAGLLTVLYATWAYAGQGLSLDNYKKLLGQALDEVSKKTPEKVRQRIEFGVQSRGTVYPGRAGQPCPAEFGRTWLSVPTCHPKGTCFEPCLN